MADIIEILNFVDYCRARDQVAVFFFQPDGTYMMLPASAELMANTEADEMIGKMLMSQYRDALASLKPSAPKETHG